MSTKKTTISDIASKTGFSKTTVSFAFNKPERISPETRERILEAARQEGYIPDPMARNFASGNHMSVGLLLPQKVESSLANPYTHGIIRGIAEVCQANGYMFTVIPPLRSSIEDAVRNATVDGLITMGLYVSDSIDSIMKRRHLPVVSIDGADDSETLTVSIDEIAAAKLQMESVLEMGHRRIAVLSLQDNAYAAKTPTEAVSIVKKRKYGYGLALSEAGMSFDDIVCINTETTFDEGFRNASSLLDLPEDRRPTCFVCMSDISALGAIAAATSRGLSVPADVSVIGFDGLEDSKYYNRNLTTIRQSAYEKGLSSARILFDIMKGKSVDEKVIRIPFSFAEGSTLGKAPR